MAKYPFLYPSAGKRLLAAVSRRTQGLARRSNKPNRRSLTAQRCVAVTAAGKPCAAWPLRDSMFCALHTEGRASELGKRRHLRPALDGDSSVPVRGVSLASILESTQPDDDASSHREEAQQETLPYSRGGTEHADSATSYSRSGGDVRQGPRLRNADALSLRLGRSEAGIVPGDPEPEQNFSEAGGPLRHWFHIETEEEARRFRAWQATLSRPYSWTEGDF